MSQSAGTGVDCGTHSHGETGCDSPGEARGTVSLSLDSSQSFTAYLVLDNNEYHLPPKLLKSVSFYS